MTEIALGGPVGEVSSTQGLSSRELQVLKLSAEGTSIMDMVRLTGLSKSDLQECRTRIRRKLNVPSERDAVRQYKETYGE